MNRYKVSFSYIERSYDSQIVVAESAEEAREIIEEEYDELGDEIEVDHVNFLGEAPPEPPWVDPNQMQFESMNGV